MCMCISAAQRQEESDYCSGTEEGVELQRDLQGSQEGILQKWYCSAGSRARRAKVGQTRKVGLFWA
ncbi:hypothetical protein EJB05_50334, partial [Eragrostis curvula]